MGEYTTNYSLYKPDIGETEWGDKVNQNFDIIDSELFENRSDIDNILNNIIPSLQSNISFNRNQIDQIKKEILTMALKILMNQALLNAETKDFYSIVADVITPEYPYGYKNTFEEIPSVWYEITIDNTNNANDLTDYQILLEITNDPQFFEDCSYDQKYLEFYDEDKTTLLNHYVELWDTVNYNAKIWIKVPSIQANSTKKIYLRINKGRTEDLSNGDATFDFFDDFEDGVIDTSKWTVISGDWVEENGYLKGTGDGSTYARKTIRVEGVCLKNFVAVMIWKVSQEDCLANFIYRAQSTNIETADRYWARIESRSDYGQGIHMLKEVGGSETDFGNIIPYSEFAQFKKLIVKVFENKHYYEVEGVGSATITDSSIMNEGYFGFQTEKYSTFIEIICIRKYTEPEPTVSYERQAVTGDYVTVTFDFSEGIDKLLITVDSDCENVYYSTDDGATWNLINPDEETLLSETVYSIKWKFENATYMNGYAFITW